MFKKIVWGAFGLLILGALLLLLAAPVFSEVKGIVSTKGSRYTVEDAEGVIISNHSQQHTATAAAIKHAEATCGTGETCTVYVRQDFELRIEVSQQVIPLSECIALYGDTYKCDTPIQPSPTPVPALGPHALYSYSSDIANAIPLEGATVGRGLVYIFWEGEGTSRVTYYCCKGLTGDAAGEAHGPSKSSTLAPFGISIDMAQYSTQGNRELYIDYRIGSGAFENQYTTFSIQAGGPGGTDPVATPTPEPIVVTPTPTPEPVVILRTVTLSWDAPTKREDGSMIAEGDLVRYDVEWNGGVIALNEVANTSHTIEGLVEGLHAFRIRVADRYGLMSDWTDYVSVTVTE